MVEIVRRKIVESKKNKKILKLDKVISNTGLILFSSIHAYKITAKEDKFVI